MQEIATDTYEIDGVKFWNSNNSPVPHWVYDEADLECPQIQRGAYDADLDKWTEKYKKHMEKHEHSAEELFEMRAAFGEGETVVNVLTGKKIVL